MNRIPLLNFAVYWYCGIATFVAISERYDKIKYDEMWDRVYKPRFDNLKKLGWDEWTPEKRLSWLLLQEKQGRFYNALDPRKNIIQHGRVRLD